MDKSYESFRTVTVHFDIIAKQHMVMVYYYYTSFPQQMTHGSQALFLDLSLQPVTIIS